MIQPLVIMDPDEGVPRYVLVDALLRQHLQRAGEAFLEVARLAAEVEEKGYYALRPWEYGSAEDYFWQRFGLRPRTLARYRTVLAALAYLPPGQIQDARLALTGLGVHKAAILAPVLHTDEAGRWQTWVAFAQDATEDAVQERVTTALGLQPRGPTRTDRFLRYVLNQVPEDARAEVEAVFAAGRGLLNREAPDSVSALAVFLAMVREVKVEWGRQNR